MSLKEQQQIRAERTLKEAENIRVLPQTEANLVHGECSVLGDMLTEVDDWENVDDEVVGNAMRMLARWQDQMNSVERAYRKFENVATLHSFSQTTKDAVLSTYETYRDRFETARDAAMREDVTRGLYTLEPPRTEIIQHFLA